MVCGRCLGPLCYLCTENKAHMYSRVERALNILGRIKYILVAVIGTAFVGFADENSIVNLLGYRAEIARLEEAVAEHRAAYKADSAKLRQLERDPAMIERIARERYYMKEDGEEIFVMSDEMEAEGGADGTAR